MDTIKGLIAVLVTLVEKLCRDNSTLGDGIRALLVQIQDECFDMHDQQERDKERTKYLQDELDQADQDLGNMTDKAASRLEEIKRLEARVTELERPQQGEPTYGIFLRSYGDNKISCIKAARVGASCFLGLKEAKELVERVEYPDEGVWICETKDVSKFKEVVSILNGFSKVIYQVTINF